MRLPEEKNSAYEQPPIGTHVAVCYKFVDLGTHTGTYQGQPTSPKRQVRIFWELTDEKMDDGRPFQISRQFSWSMNEKSKLRQTLEAWRGKPFEKKDFGANGFDVKNLIGAPCLINIIHEKSKKDGSDYARIASISPLAKSMPKPAMINPPLFFSLEPDEYDGTLIPAMPQYIRDLIINSPEYAALNNKQSPAVEIVEGAPDDEIPF